MTVRLRSPLDEYARQAIARHPNAIVSWWLMAAYLYYCTDEVLLTDGCFDELSRDMLARWETIEHEHKHLIDADALRAGTGFHLAERDYPRIVVGAATRLILERPPYAESLDMLALNAGDVSEIPPEPRTTKADIIDTCAASFARLTNDLREAPPPPVQGDLFG